VRLLALTAELVIVHGRPTTAAEVTPAAVWQPAPKVLTGVRAKCAKSGGDDLGDCFVIAMTKAGASSAAVEFARRFGGMAYLEALDGHAAGPVALAHVFFPYRANENRAWFLVNGMPESIDVDARDCLAVDALERAPEYRALLRRYPELMLWPGTRGAVGPRPASRPHGRESFIIAYRLRNLCHACAVVGHVRFAFDFERSGEFLGTHLVSVIPAH
jgi:hypothetical protein